MKTWIVMLIIVLLVSLCLNTGWSIRNNDLKQQYQQLEEDNSTLMAALDSCRGAGPR